MIMIVSTNGADSSDSKKHSLHSAQHRFPAFDDVVRFARAGSRFTFYYNVDG